VTQRRKIELSYGALTNVSVVFGVARNARFRYVVAIYEVKVAIMRMSLSRESISSVRVTLSIHFSSYFPDRQHRRDMKYHGIMEIL